MRERAVLALLSEPTIAQAAHRCGVGERTLRRWLAEDATFQTEYESARTTTFRVGMARVQGLMARAVETLEELLEAKKHPSVRLSAARIVADLAVHQHDTDTILRKLTEIERVQQMQGNG